MKIAAYAHLHRGTVTPTGVGQHLIHMLQGLQRRPDIDLRILAPRNQLDRKGQIPAGNPLAGFAVAALPLDRRWLEAMWEYLNFPKIDRWSGPVDWVYSPTEVYIAVNRPRLAVTVHDLHAFEPDLPWSESAAHRAFRRRWARMMAPIVAHASCILAASEFTRSRLVKLLHVAPDRVAIVGNGVDPVYFDRPTEAIGPELSDAPYVMVVGGLTRRKGGDRVLRMAEELGRELPSMRVLVTGHNEAEFCNLAAALGNVTLLQYVPATELARRLRGATAAVLLSRYEGFGIPVLEAMASGAPVISSRDGALPEVVGDAGILLDGDSPREVVSAIKWLSTDLATRDDYCTMGRKRAQEHRWERCVDRLADALQSR